MKKIRIAVATDDGKKFVGRHFGDADYYDVYDLTPDGSEFITRLENEAPEEEGHADPKKAKGIVGILKKHGVHAGLTRMFGPNIKRIKSKIVCVITKHEDVIPGLAMAQGQFETIAAEWDKGESRDFLDFRNI